MMYVVFNYYFVLPVKKYTASKAVGKRRQQKKRSNTSVI